MTRAAWGATTPVRAAHAVPRQTAEQYRRLDYLRETLRDALATRLGELRDSSAPTESTHVDDTEAPTERCSSEAISAAVVEITARILQGVEGALERLRRGGYGLCSDCGAAIPAARLRALPFAERCRGCQESADSLRIPSAR